MTIRNAPFAITLDAPMRDASGLWTTECVKQLLLEGETISPIGQLSKAASSWLRGAVKKGWIVSFEQGLENGGFPKARTVFCLNDEVRAGEEARGRKAFAKLMLMAASEGRLRVAA